MVSIDGSLRPFRMNIRDFIELMTQLGQKLEWLKELEVTAERFSEKCKNIDEMATFLKDIHIPKVVKNFRLLTYSEPVIHFSFDNNSASYWIRDAADMDQARSIEDLIVAFFKKRSASRVFSPFVAVILGLLLVMLAFSEFGEVAKHLRGDPIEYLPLQLFMSICSITFLLYIVWSSYTDETPSFSFFHSLIYVQEPRSNAVWILVSSILIEILIALFFTFID